MRWFNWSSLSEDGRRDALARPVQRIAASVVDRVAAIIADVEREGAEAVARWAERLDGASPEAVELTPAAITRARDALDAQDIAAIERAVENVGRYHEAARPRDVEAEPFRGARCRQVWRPIRAAVFMYRAARRRSSRR